MKRNSNKRHYVKEIAHYHTKINHIQTPKYLTTEYDNHMLAKRLKFSNQAAVCKGGFPYLRRIIPLSNEEASCLYW